MLSRILSGAEDELILEERRVLARLRTALARFDAVPEHQQALARSIEQLDELFLLVIVVINKVDILEGEAQVDEVRAFVADSARRLLGFSPEIFPVSARLALRAKHGDSTLWPASRFETLERYIRETLDAPGRVQLKLLNPLGVGAALTDRHAMLVKERTALLKDDFSTLDEVERQLALYQTDLMRDFGFRISDIDRILLEMEKRGREFFDDTMRIGRVMDLLNRSRVQQGVAAGDRLLRSAQGSASAGR